MRRRSAASGAKSSTATATTGIASPYVGRFAPTPSGELHLGSLYCAAASYLDARAHQGRWLLRIEDLDVPREAPGSAASIMRTLEALGFQWDGTVLRQSGRTGAYEAALAALDKRQLLFACGCSRAALADESRYPGTCRHLSLTAAESAIRLRVDPLRIDFTDRVQGAFRQDIAMAAGDLLVRRRDRIFSYVLAVVVDDADQGVTHIVRGADLLDNTPRQIYLQRLLGAATPVYAHVPVLMENDGRKLSKSRRSVRIDPGDCRQPLLAAFSLLGLSPPPDLADGSLEAAWAWATANWDVARVPKTLSLTLPADAAHVAV